MLLAALAELGVVPPEDVRAAVLALDAYYIPTRYPDALDFADAAQTYGGAEARAAVQRADTRDRLGRSCARYRCRRLITHAENRG